MVDLKKIERLGELGRYKEQAEEFLKDTKTKIEIKFLKKDFYFHNDEEKRNIFEVELKRGSRVFSFKFGDSIANTEKGEFEGKRPHPSFYSILAGLNSEEFDNVDEFAGMFGYNLDNNKIKDIINIFEAVNKEAKNLKILYNDEELEALELIQ